MKLRTKRTMRTRPRLWTMAYSEPCAPEPVYIGGVFFGTATARRVKRRFFAQDARPVRAKRVNLRDL